MLKATTKDNAKGFATGCTYVARTQRGQANWIRKCSFPYPSQSRLCCPSKTVETQPMETFPNLLTNSCCSLGLTSQSAWNAKMADDPRHPQTPGICGRAVRSTTNDFWRKIAGGTFRSAKSAAANVDLLYFYLSRNKGSFGKLSQYHNHAMRLAKSGRQSTRPGHHQVTCPSLCTGAKMNPLPSLGGETLRLSIYIYYLFIYIYICLSTWLEPMNIWGSNDVFKQLPGALKTRWFAAQSWERIKTSSLKC